MRTCHILMSSRPEGGYFSSISIITHRYLIGKWEARWPSGRASDSRARGQGFDPHSGRRVVLCKIRLPPKSTGNTQEALAPS